MFIKKDASLIVEILRKYLPDQIVDDPDIIVAGGSVLNFYMINEVLSGLDENNRAITKKHFEQTPLIKFSDVDLWLLKDSKSNNAPLFEHQPADESDSNKRKLRFQHRPYIFAEKEDLSVKEHKSFMQEKGSDWANTYAYLVGKGHHGIPIKPVQCIVKYQDSPEALLSTFDLGLSSVAIHRGEFIIHKSLMASQQAKEISYNKRPNFKRRSYGSRVFMSLRYFKYLDKTGFGMSDEVYKDVLGTMSDASEYYIACQEQAKTKSASGSTATVKITTSDNYEQEITVKASINDMTKRLAQEFITMTKMRQWDITHALFIKDCNIFNIKHILDERLKEVEKKAAVKPSPAQCQMVIDPLDDMLDI